MEFETTQYPSKIELTEKLTWELLDEQLPESGLRELEDLMRNDVECLQCYVSCVQLEQDLRILFRADNMEEQPALSPQLPEFPQMGVASGGNPAMPSQ